MIIPGDLTSQVVSKIEKNNLAVYSRNGVIHCSDEVAVQSIIDTFEPLADVQQEAIDKIYQKVKERIEAISAAYSAAEIAMLPFLQIELIPFNLDGTVGPFMQKVIGRGRHTAQSLNDSLAPLTALQDLLLQQRDIEVLAVEVQTNWELIDVPKHIANIDAVIG